VNSTTIGLPWRRLTHDEPRIALTRAFLAVVAVGLSIAVVAIALSPGSPILLVPIWAAITAAVIRWPFPAFLVYAFLLPLSPDYVGVVVPQVMALNGSRLLALCFLPGLLLSLLADPARLRALLRPLPIAVVAFWAIVGVTPLWSRGTVTGTGAVRDGLLFGLDYLLPCLITLGLVRDLRRARTLILVLLAGAVILILFAVDEFATGNNPFVHLSPLLPGAGSWTPVITRAGLPRVEVNFGQTLSFGRYLALLAPLAVWASGTAETTAQRWCLAAVASVLAVGVLLTLSAGPTFTLILGLGLATVARGRRSLPATVGVLVATAIFVFVMPFSPQVREAIGSWIGIETSVSVETRRNFEYRVTVYEIARHGLETSPIFGYGNRGSVPVLSPTQDILNTYVVHLMRNGLVGLGAFLAINLAFLYTAGRAALRSTPLRGFALVIAGVMIAQLIFLLSTSPIGPGERMFWVFVGLAGAVLVPRTDSESEMRV
jgi:hypothetical protein